MQCSKIHLNPWGGATIRTDCAVTHKWTVLSEDNKYILLLIRQHGSFHLIALLHLVHIDCKIYVTTNTGGGHIIISCNSIPILLLDGFIYTNHPPTTSGEGLNEWVGGIKSDSLNGRRDAMVMDWWREMRWKKGSTEPTRQLPTNEPEAQGRNTRN